jgi:hypothetical protein
MSQNKDFVEREDSKFVLQLKDFWEGLGLHGATLGFTVAEISEAEKDYKYMDFVLKKQSNSQTYSQGYTQFKKEIRKNDLTTATEPGLAAPAAVTSVAPDVEGRFRKMAEKAKAHTAYTTAIGEVLHIVAPVSSGTLPTPTFKIFMDSGHPLIKWVKGDSDGVEIWKDDGTGYKKLDRDNKSPYVDKSDLPAVGQSAVWKYKMIYLLDDETTGDYSAEISVTVRGEV